MPRLTTDETAPELPARVRPGTAAGTRPDGHARARRRAARDGRRRHQAAPARLDPRGHVPRSWSSRRSCSSCSPRPSPARWSTAVFGLTAIMLFGTSAVYHRGTLVPPGHAVAAPARPHEHLPHHRRAPTRPLAVLLLPTDLGDTLLVVVWAGALLGLLARDLLARRAALGLRARLRRARLGGRLVYLPAVLPATGGPAIVWLVAGGGLAYSSAPSSTALKRPNPSPQWFGFHEIFHVLTVVGYGCHYVAVSIASYAPLSLRRDGHRPCSGGSPATGCCSRTREQRRAVEVAPSGTPRLSSSSSPTTPSGADDQRAPGDPLARLPDGHHGADVLDRPGHRQRAPLLALSSPAAHAAGHDEHLRARVDQPARATPGTAGRSRSARRTAGRRPRARAAGRRTGPGTSRSDSRCPNASYRCTLRYDPDELARRVHRDDRVHRAVVAARRPGRRASPPAPPRPSTCAAARAAS